MVPIIAALMNAGLGILGNAVATKGKDFIEDKLGVNIENLLGTDEGKIELLKVQNAHEEMLQKYALETLTLETESHLKHTADARNMQVAALAQEDVFSKRFVYYFASFWSLVSAGYIGFITFGTIPAANVRFADTILGFILGTIIATLIGYFFGSTKNSQVKDATIAAAVVGMKQ